MSEDSFDVGHNYDDGEYGDGVGDENPGRNPILDEFPIRDCEHLRTVYKIPDQIPISQIDVDAVNDFPTEHRHEIAVCENSMVDALRAERVSEEQLYEAAKKILSFPPFSDDDECIKSTSVVLKYISLEVLDAGRRVMSVGESPARFMTILNDVDLYEGVKDGMYDYTINEDGNPIYEITEMGKKKKIEDLKNCLPPEIVSLLDGLSEFIENKKNKKNTDADNEIDE